MSNLFLIPARGGSKGILGKNLSLLSSIPLINFSIKFSLLVRNKNTDIICVSSDNQNIIDVASQFNGIVVLKRPAEYSTDEAKSITVAKHALSYFKSVGMEFKLLTLLQPTCPFRRKSTYFKAIKLMREINSLSLISVRKEEYIQKSVSYLNNGQFLYPLTDNHDLGNRRQDEVPYYIRTGNLYITSVEHILKKNSFISNNPLYVENDIFEFVNIDTKDDLKLAKIISKYWIKNEHWNS